MTVRRLKDRDKRIEILKEMKYFWHIRISKPLYFSFSPNKTNITYLAYTRLLLISITL